MKKLILMFVVFSISLTTMSFMQTARIMETKVVKTGKGNYLIENLKLSDVDAKALSSLGLNDANAKTGKFFKLSCIWSHVNYYIYESLTTPTNPDSATRAKIDGILAKYLQ